MKKVDIMFSEIGYYSESDVKNLDKTVTNVVELLLLRNKSIATAESCTGGLLSELITSVVGASNVFELGLCTYANRMKNTFLNVPYEELDLYGAVSPQVAISMVKGLENKSQADICVSVTGLAGPDGGSPEQPVGTVYAGFSYSGEKFVKLLELWKLDDTSRNNIRRHAALFIFEIIEQLLMEDIQKNA